MFFSVVFELKLEQSAGFDNRVFISADTRDETRFVNLNLLLFSIFFCGYTRKKTRRLSKPRSRMNSFGKHWCGNRLLQPDSDFFPPKEGSSRSAMEILCGNLFDNR